jgi:hypothetical protein
MVDTLWTGTMKRNSLAVVQPDGSVDWLGMPRFDVEVLAAVSHGNDTAQSPPAV